MIVEKFYPSEYVNSTYEIDFLNYYKKGIRGVLFDIDNTLVPHGAPADERAKKLFIHLRQIGMECCVISNNKEPRVKSFADAVGANYIFKADKPSKRGYQRAMQQMKTNANTTIFVGDQLFTDVWGARRCGIYSILVKPIHPKEEIQIVLKRYLEKIVLYFYQKK